MSGFFDAILNGDDYQRGFDEGKKAAIEGKDRNYVGMGMSLKFVFHGSEALDSYTAGYNRGYDVGMIQKSVISDADRSPLNIDNQINNNQIDKNMCSNSTSGQQYLKEMEALVALYRFLVNCCDEIIEVKATYRQYVLNMASTGVTRETCQMYADQYFVEDAKYLESIYKNIIDRDLPRVRQYMQMIANSYSQSQGSSLSIPTLPTPDTSKVGASVSSIRNINTQSLECQADALCDLLDFLIAEYISIQDTLKSYLLKCQNLEECGVPTEMCKDYASYAQINYNGMKTAANRLKDVDYPYVYPIFTTTTSNIAAVGNNYSRTPKGV